MCYALHPQAVCFSDDKRIYAYVRVHLHVKKANCVYWV